MRLFRISRGPWGVRLLLTVFLALSASASFAAGQKAFDTDPYAGPTNPPKEEQALLKLIQKSRSKSVPAHTVEIPGGSSGGAAGRLAVRESASVPEKPPVDEQSFSRRVFLETTTMPEGGNYAASAQAMQQFKKSIFLRENGNLQVDPANAKPSFCSSATYLVFLSVLSEMQDLRSIPSNKTLNEKLLVHSQPDGVGVWGRWNANGPGTALLVKELKLGENFVELEKAVPGDFLKVWWTKEIGAKEHGHSVVYLGTRTDNAGESWLKFWSSNISGESNKRGGYGVKEVSMSKVKNLLFSRITNPSAIQNLGTLKTTNEFLVSMTSKTVSIEDVKKELGISK